MTPKDPLRKAVRSGLAAALAVSLAGGLAGGGGHGAAPRRGEDRAAEVARAAGVPLATIEVGPLTIVGSFGEPYLGEVGDRLTSAGERFGELFELPGGRARVAPRAAEIYLFGREREPWVAAVAYFASLSEHLPEGWVSAAEACEGFWWTDPFPLSAARQAHRDVEDLAAHSSHNYVHSLLARLEANGRHLPAWYEEAVATLIELEVHGRRAAACGEARPTSTATSAARGAFDFEWALLEAERWRANLDAALEAGAVESFDRIASRGLSELRPLDVAASMAILEWLASAKIAEPGEGAPATPLRRFHGALRGRAPELPLRVPDSGAERHEAFDAAFEAASGLGWREADEAWRRWWRASR